MERRALPPPISKLFGVRFYSYKIYKIKILKQNVYKDQKFTRTYNNYNSTY